MKTTIKEKQLIIATHSADWEGIYDNIKLYLVKREFDWKAEWKAYRTWEEHLRRIGQWPYTDTFYTSLVKHGYLEEVSHVQFDINDTGKPTLSVEEIR